MQYAVHRPARVSHLILMNTAPASSEDWQLVCAERIGRRGAVGDLLGALASTAAFADGDPDIVARYYRLDYASGFARSDRAHRLVLRFQSRDDVLRGRAIENRLMQGLFWSSGYTLLPPLRQLRVPTLVLHGDCDFVPVACAQRIAAAIPGARLAVIEQCGHFAYIEAPGEVHAAIDDFFDQT